MGNNSGPDHQSHVAQQSRRDRLRIHQQHNLERFPVFPEMNPVFSTGMIDLTASSSNDLSAVAHGVSMACTMSGSAGVGDMIGGGGDCSMHHLPISTTEPDPPGSDNWRSLGSQRSCDWMVNSASGWLGGSNQANHIMNTVSGSINCNTNSSYNGYDHGMQPSLNNLPDQISANQGMRKQSEGMDFTPPVFHSSLQDVVTIASTRGSWPIGGNELALLPAYRNHMFDDNNASGLGVYPHQHDGELGFIGRRTNTGEFSNVLSDRRTQGLSLSLWSNPPPQPQAFHSGEGYLSRDQQGFNNLDSTCSIMPKSITSRGSSGKSVKDVPGTATFTHPSTGPLGPFTGYATILRSSQFLKPTQQLLDEFCSVSGLEVVKTSEAPERISGNVSMSVDAFDVADHQELVRSKGCGSSAASSSTLYGSNDLSPGHCVVKDQPHKPCQPEYQQKKAKLVYMHEEVCRRYKQYHEQMQMVVSSFESVAGLNAATPYISLALKTVSRHFRCLRNAISDQLRYIRKALGEDFIFPTGASSSKGDANGLRQKYKEQSFQKHKSGGDNVGPQQHIWRPQRGLPERSVAILRTWLFEHFLHPYPTDTDKHMLATQTGLSRNQVSNWFINARVRVWKPMVEEIHMLETNGSTQTNKSKGNLVGEGTSCSNDEETANKLGKHLGLPGMGSSSDIGDGLSSEQWSQEKRSGVECQFPPSIDRSFMGFVPYPSEMGGLGAVSLTLGLRHSAENAQHQQQYFKPQEDQLQRQFGGHMFHDFVG